MSIQSRHIEYSDGDTLLEGFLAWDDSSSKPVPAVAVSHTWAGRSEFECSKALRLAELGYAGFAIDMYGKNIRGTSIEENQTLIAPLMDDRIALQRRINCGIAALRRQPEVDAANVAAIGFCFGGLCVLDLARSGSDVKGVVSFHGLFTPPAGTTNQIVAKVLCLHGYDDPMASPQQMTDIAAELTTAGADWQIHAYGHTQHAFTNPAANNPALGTLYDSVADRRSWQAMTNFLDEIFI